MGIVFGVNKYSDVSYEGSKDGIILGAGSYVPSTYKEEYFYDGGLTKIFLGTHTDFLLGGTLVLRAIFIRVTTNIRQTSNFLILPFWMEILQRAKF